MSKHLRKNEEIRSPKVLLIDEGKSLGELPLEKAIEMARERGLDLIEVSPQVRPPVCKIMDYGAYLYNLKKKEKKQKNASKQTETKTIRLSIRTDKHDLEVKARQARKFMENRHPIKVALIFKGREITHLDLGMDKMKEFYKMLEDLADMEQEPKRQGYQLIMILNPKK